MPAKQEALTAQQMKFATAYVRWRDVYKAASHAKINRNRAVRTFNLPQVQDEIERQQEVLRQERAKVQVEEELLTDSLLDGELVRLIRDKDSGASLQLEGIRLGYVVRGRIQAGNTRVLEQAEKGDGPMNAGVGAGSFQAFIPMGMPVRPVRALCSAMPSAITASNFSKGMARLP